MTKVDFYVLPQPGEAARQMFICRLLNKLLGGDQTVFIRTRDAQSAIQLDEFIWANKPEWFLPHQIAATAPEVSEDRKGATETLSPLPEQVEIGYPDATGNENCGLHHDVLVNLAPEIPSYFSSFQRLIEVVSQDTDVLEQTRINFKFYRDRGYPIDTHKLEG